MAKVKTPKITINNKEYLLSELSDEVKAQIQSLQFCEAEINRLNAQLAVTNTAANAYKIEIMKLLSK